MWGTEYLAKALCGDRWIRKLSQNLADNAFHIKQPVSAGFWR
jgi:hypothetical protein